MPPKKKGLTLEDQIRILELLAQNRTQQQVADEFGTSQSAISRICSRRDEILHIWKQSQGHAEGEHIQAFPMEVKSPIRKRELTLEEQVMILEALDAHKTQQQIADMHGTSQSHVSRINSHRERILQMWMLHQQGIALGREEMMALMGSPDEGKSASRRRDLTLEDRVRVLESLAANKKQQQIADEFGISQSQVSRIGTNRDKILQLWAQYQNLSRRRVRDCKLKDVDEALYNWYENSAHTSTPITGTILKQKATEIAESFGIGNFSPSNGWICRWRMRHNLATQRGAQFAIESEIFDEENTSEDEWNVTDEERSSIVADLLKAYLPEDVYAVQEVSLNFRALPEIVGYNSHSKKKDFLTVLLCVNMLGTNMLPPLIVGKGKKPASFRNSGKLPILYENNPSLLMTEAIFSDWLMNFDNKMRERQCNIILFLDSSSCHNITLPLTNVTLMFSPSPTGLVMQPMDQGITWTFKANYRKQILTWLASSLDVDGPMKELTMMDAIHMISYAWQQLNPEIIISSFHNAGFFPSSDQKQSIQFKMEPLLGINPQDFRKYVQIDDDCLEDILTQGTEDLVKAEHGYEDEDDIDEQSIPSTHDVLDAMDVLRQFLERKEPSDFSSFYLLDKQIRSHVMQAKYT